MPLIQCFVIHYNRYGHYGFNGPIQKYDSVKTYIIHRNYYYVHVWLLNKAKVSKNLYWTVYPILDNIASSFVRA